MWSSGQLAGVCSPLLSYEFWVRSSDHEDHQYACVGPEWSPQQTCGVDKNVSLSRAPMPQTHGDARPSSSGPAWMLAVCTESINLSFLLPESETAPCRELPWRPDNTPPYPSLHNTCWVFQAANTILENVRTTWSQLFYICHFFTSPQPSQVNPKLWRLLKWPLPAELTRE